MNKPSPEDRRLCEFDDVFQHVKSFGRYQCILYNGLYALTTIPMMLQFGLLVFAMGTPQFHCDITNTTCPPNTCCDNCTSYSFDGPFTSTISEWNLICDRAPIGATLQTCFFVGMLVGSFVTGILSDAFGRKICIFICFAVMAVASLGSSFVHSVPLFGFLRFCVGFSLTGTMLSCYVFNMEIVGPTWRTLAGNLTEFYWHGSGILYVLLAYLIRDWRMLIIASSVPAYFLFLFWRLVPRSPRWLVAHGHLDEATKVLMKFGEKANTPVGPEVLRAMVEDVRRDQIIREQNKKKHTPLDLFRTPKTRKWTILLCYNWFVVALVNFALFLFLTSLAGNIYLNATLMRFFPFVGNSVLWIMHKKIGRRISSGVLMLLVGASCLLILAVPIDQPIIKSVLAICGYAFVNLGGSCVFLITSELFPTVLRNTAVGTGSTAARVGAILAPYLAMMGHLPGVGLSLPVTLFGVLALVAGIVTYWIPETLFANMHQTIEEAEAAKDDYGMPCCRESRALEEENVNFQQDTNVALIQQESAM